MADSIALLVMTHGDLGKAAVASAELIVGKQENVDTVSVFVVDQVDDLKQEMFNKVEKLDTSKGLVILTDIVGGTPTNLASYLLQDENTVLASGINLPMLLEVLMNRGGSIQSIAGVLADAYQHGLVIRTDKDIKGVEEDEYSL